MRGYDIDSNTEPGRNEFPYGCTMYCGLMLSGWTMLISSAIYQGKETYNRRVWFHFITVSIFSVFLTIAVVKIATPNFVYEFFFIFSAVVLVHLTRFTFDRIERGRLDLSYIFALKDVFDPLVNISIIIFAVFVAKYHLSSCLVIVALALSTMLAAKELFFRIYVDLFTKRRYIGGSSERRDLPEDSGNEVSLFHGLFSRFTKSIFYVVVGYALVYMLINNADILYPVGSSFKTHHASSSYFIDYSYFSMFQMLGGGYGDFAPLQAVPKAVALTEAFVGLIFIGLVLVKAVDAPAVRH